MGKKIKKAAVIGAGTMGGGIAAHLANAGLTVYLLDIVPQQLTDEDKAEGLGMDDPRFRNRYSLKAIERIIDAKPPHLYSKRYIDLIIPGNIEDNISLVSEADWIIEAVVEDLEIKKSLFRKIGAFWKKGTIISTNTSGISIESIASEFSDDMKEYFLGTHFFNPPRYMKLLEIIPSSKTRKDVLSSIVDFAERYLGKGVVIAKDTPNFIANRIGIFSFMLTVKLMIEEGFSIEEVDLLTGDIIGRPRTATFRTADMVGLDIIINVAENLYNNALNDERRDIFKVDDFMRKMKEQGLLGEKTGAGFYRRERKDGERETFFLDYKTFQYQPVKKPVFASIELARNIEDPGKRIRKICSGTDRASNFIWKVISETIIYAASRIPEIADSPTDIDKAMRWGFGWKLGPFEILDSLNVRDFVSRIEREGRQIPAFIERIVERDLDTIYKYEDGRRYFFNLKDDAYREETTHPRHIILSSIKRSKGTIRSNPGASLIDIGDGIACLEFHSKANVIGVDTIQMLKESLRIVSEDFDALIIGNQGEQFSAGANLMLILLEAEDGNWDEIERMVKEFQQLNMSIKYFEKPVISAIFGMTLGGGCEIALSSSRIQAVSETYMGLVEVAVGLVPAGGGIKELLIRNIEHLPDDPSVDLLPFVRNAFECIARAKVSSSADEARELRFLREHDSITHNLDFLLYDAKQTALSLVSAGYRPPFKKMIRVGGEELYSAIKAYLYLLKEGGFISQHDYLIGSKIAFVISGGRITAASLVTEEYILDLEREVFLSLCGEKKTQERIRHMLRTGKPLRN